MAGTLEGGRKARETNKLRHGADFYAKIGRKGGKNGTDGGFGSDLIGEDGLTGPQRAIIAGKIGGSMPKKPRTKKNA